MGDRHQWASASAMVAGQAYGVSGMRRAFTFGTLLAALSLIAWTSAASAQDATPVGEVCVQQNGVYVAKLRIGFYKMASRVWSYRDDSTLAIGQSHCVKFTDDDVAAHVQVNAILGHSKECVFKTQWRPGRLTVTTSGTTLNVGLTCP